MIQNDLRPLDRAPSNKARNSTNGTIAAFAKADSQQLGYHWALLELRVLHDCTKTFPLLLKEGIRPHFFFNFKNVEYTQVWIFFWFIVDSDHVQPDKLPQSRNQIGANTSE